VDGEVLGWTVVCLTGWYQYGMGVEECACSGIVFGRRVRWLADDNSMRLCVRGWFAGSLAGHCVGSL
jgi:hypothetical protein